MWFVASFLFFLNGVLDLIMWFNYPDIIHIAYNQTSGYFIPSWVISVTCFLIMLLCWLVGVLLNDRKI